ncbi:MAG: cytochrome D1 domain-containing protein [Bacteroidota bacterium]
MKISVTRNLLMKIPAYLVATCLLVPLGAVNAWAAKGGGGGGGNNPPPDTAAGQVMFQGICFACHGTDAGGRFDRKSIKNKSASSIAGAVDHKAYAMAFLTYLTDTDYDNLAAYLRVVSGAGAQLLYGTGNAANGEVLFRKSCTGCHSINNGTGPGHGPDLKSVPSSPEWVQAFIAEPKAMATHAYTADLLGQYPYIMPNLGLGDYAALDLEAFIHKQQLNGPLLPSARVPLTQAEFDQTKYVYFDHCAGCHGLYRKGATGPNIEPARAAQIGTDGLGAMVRYGTPGGMPAWGLSGSLSEDNIAKLAAYLQMTPPAPPPMPMSDIQASWRLIVPVDQRPTSPQTARNWQNYFGAVLRDAGQIAIYDGDTKEEVARLNVGFAVHILRSSSTGRYFYAIGRDGLVSLIDLWAGTPNIVATVKGCSDARSVESSKFAGFEDAYLIEGCYWPPQYVVYNGLTLEPLVRQDLPMTSITGETLPEVRVASIVASPFEPLWVVSLKESGYVGLVDYSQPGFPLVAKIPAEKYLHDGGWDHTKRYFLVAANASNKMVVIDVANRSFVTSFTTGNKPHPGRGANWEDPVYGWVNATPHLGENKVSIYGADPANHPEFAWKVVREITLPGSGSLFLKTHPNSPWVLFDMALSTDASQKQICAYSKQNASLDRCFTVATNGKATHMEFNQDGSQVWIADWATDGSLIILDSQTLAEIKRITGVPSPTGKFNVYNTTHDVY